MNRVVESGGAVHSPKKEHCYKMYMLFLEMGTCVGRTGVGFGKHSGFCFLSFLLRFFFLFYFIFVLRSCLLTPAHVSSLCLDICHLDVSSSGDELMGSNVWLY